MRRRRAGVALAISLLLLTAACGSQQAGVFHPTGALAAAGPQSPATPSGALVPFPGRVRFEFDPLPAGRTQAAVVARDRDFILAYYYAIYTAGRNKSYLAYVANSGVLATVQAAIAEHVAAKQGFAGVDKHFGTTVTQAPYNPGDLSVSYCVDEAGLHYTDLATGRVLRSAATSGPLYYLESDTFARGSHGVWDLVGTLVTPYPQGQARECKP